MTKFITVRQASINEANALCDALGMRLYMSPHFIERVNLRSPKQDTTFIGFLKAVKFMQSRPDFYEKKPDGKHQIIEIQIGSEHYLSKIDAKQLSFLTYYFNEIRHGTTDRLFKLKEPENVA